MTAAYFFAAATGVPLIIWFLLAGGDEGGAGGDDGADASSGGGIGGVMLRLLPLSTIAFVLATFGVCGLVLGALGTGAGTTFLAAAGAGVVAGAVNSTLFSYLRRSGSTSDVSDRQLAGAVGRVVLPVAAARRGRVSVSVAGQQVYLSAETMPEAPAELEVGASVLVVEVERGVALVTRLDPELT